MIVTGGASGIGAETVRALAGAGAEVTVATRDPGRAVALTEEFAGSGPGSVRAVALDLADLASVDAFVAAWAGPLHALVANAGVMAVPTRQVTPQGWELQLATNYLGHFALVRGLRDHLRAGSGRVVVVSSGAQLRRAVDFDDPQFDRRPYDPWEAYFQSKTADVLLVVGIARHWAADGITANAANPGYVMTNLQRHLDEDTLRAFGVTVDEEGDRTVPDYYKTPAQGAATSVLLAASPMLAGVTGRYFEDNQEAAVVPGGPDATSGVAEHAVDPAAADRLWAYAEQVITSR
ncbi:NAD(P)-dependent dehydrogenase, short-chain alcohol dehydrogenase family [Micromonospora humi]|uniref:Probable oxidoreductase n=2 Tax=Micromonospora humi TaxID=745366 RepID=A0A1C5K3M1_9ACTN|nr:NAD(P)-dependent dehydrogenase, short-chain alcohol dehydrogenase family [Micromonospora humi]